MSGKIHIIFPCSVEAESFRNPNEDLIEVNIGGVGLCEIGAFTAKLIVDKKPRITILAGIAGAYPDAGLKIGDCVVVARERATDQGAFRDGSFISLYAKEYLCPYTELQKALPIVNGSSVNGAASTTLSLDGESVESMEGAAFFATCLAFETPFLEIRAISNYTTSRRDEWRLEVATKTLAEALYKLIDEIKA